MSTGLFPQTEKRRFILDPMNIGIRIKELRKERKITQKVLSIKTGIDQGTISNWERGRNEPDAQNRKKIADYFGVSEAELFGDFEIKNLSQRQISTNKIPVISWVKANRFAEISDPFSPGDAEDWVYSTTKGDNMFALKVSEDCMEPEFRAGDIVIIKPNVSVSNGDYVIVKDSKLDKATFKQYKVYGKKVILHPLNPNYADIELDHDERYEVIGKVVEKVKKY